MMFQIRGLPSVQQVKLEGNTISGVAIPYNSRSLELGGFVEEFAPGAVTEAVASGQLEAWAYHDQTKPLGSQAGGSLRFSDTATGLNYELDIPDTTDGQNMRALMTPPRNDIQGTSFGFRATDEKWSRDAGQNVRRVIKADMNHISPVLTPAYPASSAQLRSLNAEETKETSERYGIDLSKIANIFVARNKGLAIELDEMEIAREAIKLLSETIQTPKLKQAMERAANVLL
jgi:hypothetical protein